MVGQESGDGVVGGRVAGQRELNIEVADAGGLNYPEVAVNDVNTVGGLGNLVRIE